MATGEPHVGPEVPHPHLLDAVHLQVHLQPIWCSLPLAIEAKQRGKDAPGSATKTRNLRRSEARKEASSFLAALGLDKPADKDEWRTVLREMGSFLATKVFLTNCPAPVMEMPVAPVHNSKEAMRFRAICDERITIPAGRLEAVPGSALETGGPTPTVGHGRCQGQLALQCHPHLGG